MGLEIYIKRLFFRKDRFARLNVADVIWAKRYKNRKQEKQIPEGHKNGPYIVIHKRKNKLHCLKCTSVEPPKHCENLYYSLGKIRLGMDKDTYVKLSEVEVIRPKRYLNFMSRIGEEDFNTINKRMYLLKKQNPKFNIKKRYCKFGLRVGDVVTYKDNLFYIFGIDKKYYLANYLREATKKDTDVVKVNSIRYIVDKDKVTKIRKRTRLELANTID